jgi:phosphatidylserine decarboxylase
LLNRLAVILQYCLPKQLITVLVGKFASAQAGRLTTSVIRWFVCRYQVDMSEAANADITSYTTFNAFFTRALKSDARPRRKCDFICPVDGAISQFGEIHHGQIIQAKGHEYSVNALLADDGVLAAKFVDGHFATIYLSPKDYHRIHMPCDGRLKKMTYVPGALFSVNPVTAQAVPGLFARNERIVCEFESREAGHFVMVLVGATIVGSMATTWHGVVNPPRSSSVRSWDYEGKNINLRQGDEMGRFLLGSTVVMLFENGQLEFEPSWSVMRTVKLGEVMGNRRTPSPKQ